MSERKHFVEPEEQVDLDGDNDMDDYDEDPVEEPVEEDDYQKGRDESTEDEEEQGYGDEDDDGNGGRHEKNSMEYEGNNDASGSAQKAAQVDEDRVESMMDDDERKKREDLLALPPHGSEVFVGGLPRDTSEEELRDLCESYGDIFEVKLVKDKETKESKGFAFIMFTNSEAAQNAIEGIHDKEFKGRTLRCSLSQAKHRLFVGNVPKNLTEEELRKIFEDNGPGVKNIEMFKDLQNPTRNRGFLFVEYYNHACAEYSRQKMSNANFKMDGSIPTVTWADPKNTGDSSAASQVKAIYVKNLPENVPSEKLKQLFERHGEVTKVVLPPSKTGQGKRDFGFIHFAERASALKAVKGTEKYEIDGHAIEVTLAKPQADKKHDHSAKPGAVPSIPPYPVYSYPDPYGAYGGGFGQPMIYGRGPMPSGMRMVPMVLPDGRLGYVLQQPAGVQLPPPPSHHHHRRDDRSGGSREGGGRGGDGYRGRRYRPY